MRRRRSSTTPEPSSSLTDRVRIITNNVRDFRDGVDRVLGVVRALRPDFLLLQEAGLRRRLRRFAVGASMRAASDPWSPVRRRVKNAVLLANPRRPTLVVRSVSGPSEASRRRRFFDWSQASDGLRRRSDAI